MPTDDQISDAEAWLAERRKDPGWGLSYDQAKRDLASDEEYVTKTGRRLTQADVDELVAEAEAGYDVSHITRRLERVGKELHIVDPVSPSFTVTGSPEPPRRITPAERLTIERDATYHYAREQLEHLALEAGIPLEHPESGEVLRNFQLVIALTDWIKEHRDT